MSEVLLRQGLPGVAILGLALAVVWLAKRLHDVQEKRVNDAKDVTSLLVENQRETQEAIGALTVGVDKLVEAQRRRNG